MRAIRARVSRDEGMTLIEVSVVLVIIGILVALAGATFIRARSGAQDRHAQANLRHAVLAQKVHFVDHSEYSTDVTALTLVEAALRFTTSGFADARANEVTFSSTGAGNSARVWMASTSATGRTFCVADLGGLQTFYRSGDGCYQDPTEDPVGAGWSPIGY